MSYTARKLIKAARKKGYRIEEGSKHILVYDPIENHLISTIPRGKLKKGTVEAIIKQMNIKKNEL